MTEEAIHVYHLGLGFIAKISLMEKSEIALIRERLLREALGARLEEDVFAMRALADLCEVYLNAK